MKLCFEGVDGKGDSGNLSRPNLGWFGQFCSYDTNVNKISKNKKKTHANS